MNLKELSKQVKKDREVMSLQEYLDRAKTDPSLYASPQARLLKAIGEPEIVESSKSERLSVLFDNKLIKIYPAFKDFFGLEIVIEKIVNYLTFAAQGLEERKQILYLFGPPGSAKSSLADKLKELMEKEPFYCLAIERDGKLELSPVHESPLGLFTKDDAAVLGISARAIDIIPSPWAIKRLDENDGDLTKFKVVKLYPSKLRQIAVAKTEPGDENNQDISTLVGKLDIRKLEHFSQNDPDAYRYSGGLCVANRGILDFVEMFKAPLAVLNPLLEATQGKNYNPTNDMAAIPFEGIVLAHSNEAEWETFRNHKSNEAFLDRIYLVKVPYCLRTTEEKLIYKKHLQESELADAPCVEHVYDILSRFTILSRLENADAETYLKLLVYDGRNIKDQHPSVKPYREYVDLVSKPEGFSGISTRTAFKILDETFNYEKTSIGLNDKSADPVHMITCIQNYVNNSDLPAATKDLYTSFMKSYIIPEWIKALGKDVQEASLDSFDKYGQYVFDKYVQYADYWIQSKDYRDPETGRQLDERVLNQELEIIEKKAGINNPRDFRTEIVTFCFRYYKQHNKNPSWKAFQKMRDVIEANLNKDLEKVIDIVSFENIKDKDQTEKRNRFIKNMMALGYTEKQVQRNVEYYKAYRLSK